MSHTWQCTWNQPVFVVCFLHWKVEIVVFAQHEQNAHCIFITLSCVLSSYKFTLDELYSMKALVTLRAESYKDWLCSVQEILGNKGNKKRGQKVKIMLTVNCFGFFFFWNHFLILSLITFWSGLEELHSLLEQIETAAFPKTSLADQLRIVTAEADKVAVMAQQLLNGKRQTRY